MKAAFVMLGLLMATSSTSVPVLAQSAATPEQNKPAAAAPVDEPFGATIRAFEKADAKAAPPKGAVLFIGSSSIGMWSTLKRDFRKHEVIKRGFGGSVIAQSTMYTPRIVWPYEPRLIVLYAGDNDLASGLSSEQVLADFQAFVARVREKLPATAVAFIAIKPSPSRANLKAKALKANALIRGWIEENSADGLRYIDVWTAMTDAQGNARAELFGPDKLHMNPRGYALWTRLVAPHLHATLPAEQRTPEAEEKTEAEEKVEAIK
jgi:lysophospholipase L1-like esterase